MSAFSIQPTFPIFTDIDGQPLEAGYVWIGTTNLDPQVNPINVYWDAALTIPAAQPIRTLAGYPSRNGAPARLYVNSDYSIRVMNRNGSVVYSAPEATERYSESVITGISAGAVSFSQTVAYPAGSIGAHLRQMLINVKDAPYNAAGDGLTDDTAAFVAAAATGKPLWMPQGDYLISAPVTVTSGLFGAGAGDTNTGGKTKITLIGTGQLVVSDWYCQWDGFEVRSAVNGKTMIKNNGCSYWTFTNFVISKIGAATAQVGIDFDTSTASIYFNRLDNLNIRCDYNVKITGNGTQVFNANKLGMGVGGNKWFDFLSAITVESGVLACDANEFGGYFESGTNMLTFDGVALRQNRFRLIMDVVTRVWNSTVVVNDTNLWEVLDGGFTFQGTYPQNQIFIGPVSTEIRATDTSSTPVIPNATATTMTFDGEQFDTLSEFTPGTGIFQPRNAGYYQVDAQALTQAYTWPSGTRFEVQIYKNGVLYASGMYNASETGSAVSIQRSGSVTSILYMNGTTDTMTIKLLHNRGGNVNLDTSPSYNFINITRV